MGDRRMCDEELETLIQNTVHATLTQLGIDQENPLEMQRDFQWMRRWRQASESLPKAGIVAVLGVFVTGMCAALWIGFKSLVMK